MNNQVLDVSRVEKKYILSKTSAYRLKQLLLPILSQDFHNNGDGYLVRSLYFDSFDDRDYFEKLDGYNHRKKIRLRVYASDSKTAKLEKKEKVGENQWKRSLTISKKDANRMIQGDFSFLFNYNNELANDIYWIMTEGVYRPRCIVEYDRLAFTLPTNDVRITFDSNIRATESCFNLFSNNLNFYPVSYPDEVTLEVKYNHFILEYIKDLIGSCDVISVSNSKYTLGRSVSRFHIDSYI